MDDMKRAMYIAARNAINKGQARFICLTLNQDLVGQGLHIDRLYDAPEAMEQFLEELFPEFFQLFDYKLYINTARGYVAMFSSYKHAAWFAIEDEERRLRILDFIISNR